MTHEVDSLDWLAKDLTALLNQHEEARNAVSNSVFSDHELTWEERAELNRMFIELRVLSYSLETAVDNLKTKNHVVNKRKFWKR